MEKNDPPLSGMKILLVDDNPANLDVLSIILEEEGYEISVAISGEMALKAVIHIAPDLILLDVMMPGIDGFETCRKLKNDATTKEIPIIFLSAKSDSTDIVKGFQSGGLDYIIKPFNQEEVLIRVKTQLQLRDKTKKLEEAEAETRLFAKELERSNQDLQEFASAASHDLKSPLRKIVNLGEFLKEECEDLLNEKGKDYILKMREMSIQLSQLIDSLLEYSQITRNPKPFEPCDLKQLIEKVVENLKIQIHESNGKILIGDLPTIYGEQFLLHQFFQNLISNALKFHRQGEPPVINIRGESTDNGFWKIMVDDNGIGFDEENTDKIFQPFKRLVSRSEYEGSGIGLATCKKIVDHHNGTITCQSQPEMGTTFIITLPEKPPQ